MKLRTLNCALLTAALLAAACGSDSDTAATDADRCESNKAAGTITYVSGFEFAASSGIVDVISAKEEGYFDEVCLTVELRPSYAAANAALLASGQAQFGNVGTISDVLNANLNADADMVILAHYGNTAIEGIVVPADGDINVLADIQGKLVGVKGDIPASLQNMLAAGGAPRGTFDELLLESFDPIAGGFDLGIDALPVYTNNEPYQLDAAGFDYTLFRPLDFDIPSSFGYLVTSGSFLTEHPGVVEDFLRAAFKGYDFAMNNPDAAIAHSVSYLASSDAAYLTEVTEGPRWRTEVTLVAETKPADLGFGMINSELLGAEVQLMTDNAIFDSLPDWESMTEASVAAGLYDGTDLIWPGPAGK